MPYKDPQVQRAYWNRYQAHWRKLNPEKARARDRRRSQSEKGKLTAARHEAKRKGTRADYEHKRSLYRYYGITPEQYQTLLAVQKGRCAICGSTDPGPKRRMCVDHDHKTKKVRGLLCSPCNLAIGLMKENFILFRSAIAYLIKSR